MKVLLINTNKTKHLIPVLPNGLGFTAAALRSEAKDIRLLDLCFEENESAAVTLAINEFRPDVIGISMRTCRFGKTEIPEIQMTRSLVQHIREQADAPIVLGGAAFSFDPVTVLAYVGADCGIVGDSEITFNALTNALVNGIKEARKCNLPGVLWRGDTEAPHESSVTPPEAIPIPAMDLYDPRYFTWRGAGSSVRTMKIWNLQTRRGCPYACGNCRISEIEGKTIRCRSLESVAEELTLIRQYNPLNTFFLVDNLFQLPSEHLFKLCALLKQTNPQWQWSASACNGLEYVTLDMLEEMKTAGCDALIADIITAEDTILAASGKSFGAQHIVQLFEYTKKTGIELFVHVMLGFPGETVQTAAEALRTMELINPPFLVVILGFAIYRGTSLARTIESSCIPGDHSFSPSLYISPELDVSGFRSLIAEYQARHPNWFFASVFGDPLLDGCERAITRIRTLETRK